MGRRRIERAKAGERSWVAPAVAAAAVGLVALGLWLAPGASAPQAGDATIWIGNGHAGEITLEVDGKPVRVGPGKHVQMRVDSDSDGREIVLRGYDHEGAELARLTVEVVARGRYLYNPGKRLRYRVESASYVPDGSTFQPATAAPRELGPVEWWPIEARITEVLEEFPDRLVVGASEKAAHRHRLTVASE